MPIQLPMIYYSRPRRAADWKCPRSRVWQYEFKGQGLVRAESGIELFLGTALHDGLAAIAVAHRDWGKVDIDKIASTIQKQVLESILESGTPGDTDHSTYAWEQSSLVEGLLRGYYIHVFPQFIRNYPRILAVEQETLFRHNDMGKPDPKGGFGFMSKPDLVVEDTEGQVWYIEYKSTSSKKEQWINSWNTAIQVHATVRGIETFLDRPVAGVVVQGLYKGYSSYNKQNSPLCYAYKRSGNPPFTEDQISYEYKPGFKRYPSWELPGGVKAWVEGMSAQVLGDQFPQTPPILAKGQMIDAFFAQAALRESEIAQAMQVINREETSPELMQQFLDGFFPQVFESCAPAYGYSCSYRSLCHGSIDDPLSVGFQLRDTSHEKGFKNVGVDSIADSDLTK